MTDPTVELVIQIRPEPDIERDERLARPQPGLTFGWRGFFLKYYFGVS